MSAPAMSGTDATAEVATERVSTREVRETAFRALRAVGVSAGEAVAAAKTVLESEVQGWGGLGALMHEISTITAEISAPVCGSRDAVFVVQDPSCRGPLLLGRLVFDLAAAQAARAMPVKAFVRGLGYHRVLLCLALELAERTQGMTMLTEVDSHGSATCAVACTSDGHVLAPDTLVVSDHNIPWPPDSDPANLCGGLSVTDNPHTGTVTKQWRVLSTPRERMLHRADTLHNGIAIPPDVWASVYRASRRFLVPDHSAASTKQG